MGFKAKVAGMAAGALLAVFAGGAAMAQAEGAATGTPVTPDTPVVTLNNGAVITLAQFDAVFQYEIPDENKVQFMQMPDWQKRLADEVVNMASLAEAAKSKGIRDTAEFKAMLATKETQILASLYVQNSLQAELEKIKATPEQLQDFYDKNKEQFFTGWREVSQIVVKDKAEADKVYAQVSAKPAAFADVAKKVSLDKESKAKGGDIGKVKRSSDKVTPEVIDVIYQTAKGKIAKPVQSRIGWHIVMVRDTSAVDYTPMDEKMKMQIGAQIESQLRRAAFEQAVKSTRESYAPALNEAAASQIGEAWKKANMKPASQLGQ